MENYNPLVAATLMVLCLIAECCSGDCLFEYVKQPPSTTIQDCNPYLSNDILHVQCTVRTRSDLQYYGEYQINWFKESTLGYVVNLGEGFYFEDPITTATRINISSTYFFSQQYNTSLLGKYWCQVIDTTADPDQPLMRSNVFTLLPPDNYTYAGPSCTSPQAIDNITCADLPHTIYISDANFTPYSSDKIQPTRTFSASTSPTGVMVPLYVHVAAGVSGAILLLLLIVVILSSSVTAILVMKKRWRKKIQSTPNTASKTTAARFNSHFNEQFEVATNIPSQPVLYAVPNKTRYEIAVTGDEHVYDTPNTRSTNIVNKEHILIGQHQSIGDASTGTVLFDDPTYAAAGVSNKEYVHLKDAINSGVDTVYSKLSHDGAATTSTQLTLSVPDQQQYSVLNRSAQ